MTDYNVLSQEEQDEIIVSFMQAQERDDFCHQLNLSRYETMLKTLPEGDWKSRVAKLRAETVQRLAEVRSIIAATEPQLPSAERLAVAKNRLLVKNAGKVLSSEDST
ncbi:MAG TPA: hypothetical protein VMV84_04675 [Dehalococcoidales bacterium]|nr:hypothetical protein [Dehalococcoidales bacterium]